MHICFTTQSCLPFFDDAFPMQIVGGAEMQQYYLAKHLAEKGLRVSFLSFDYGQEPIHNAAGIDFMKTYKNTAGVPGIRFFYPRLFGLWRCLRLVDADIYYARGAGIIPGILSVFCRIYSKKWVFASASDTNFTPENLRLTLKRDKIIYEYGLERANAIITQSVTQRELLKRNYGLSGTVIKNIYPDEMESSKRGERHILWVAMLRQLKRPEIFMKIAQQFPSEKFVMVGGPGSDKVFFNNMKRVADGIPNLDFKGFLPFEGTKKYFDEAKFFINTSIYEGFPNTFLQSWCRGVPVITFFDPDGVVRKNRLGLVVESTEQLYECVEKMLESYRDYSNATTTYFREHHSTQNVDQYIGLFQALFANGSVDITREK